MPCPYGSTAGRRIPVELVEADFEIGFSLIDLAHSHPRNASRILADAEAVYQDILARVRRLGAPESGSFQPLIGEFRRAIDLATLSHFTLR
jgi:hypothetical protein